MKRLDFLRKKFNVLLDKEYIKKLKVDNVLSIDTPVDTPIKKLNGIYTLFYQSPEDNSVCYPETTFKKIIEADPTKNQMYVQWLMNILKQKIETGEGVKQAKILLTEDLPKTKENLELFEGNKRKKKFKEMALKNFALSNIEDATNINQYDSLEELFAAVYPFKPIVNMSDLEKQMEYFVSIGEGELPVKDAEYTIFIPKTLRASELFEFTNWCTGSKGNTMFKHYTNNNRKPDGSPSDLIIVIDNGFLRGENDNIYQIHFETSQIMDKKDVPFNNLRRGIIDKNLSVRNYFYKTLYNLLSSCYNKDKETDGSRMFGREGISYTKYALQLGFGKILFEVMDENTPTISFVDCNLETVPDLSKFTSVSTLYLDKVNLNKIDDTFFSSKQLKIISIPRNHISKIPPSIGQCSKLKFINIKGNPIGFIPEEIKYLDPIHGGSLEKISVDNTNEDVVKRLKSLLPSVVIS